MILYSQRELELWVGVGMRWGFLLLSFIFFYALPVLGETSVSPIYCVGDRSFSDPQSKTRFDFSSTHFSLPNSYWLAVAANNSYADKDLALREFERWGFSNSPDEASDNHLFFLDKQAEFKGEILGFDYTIPYASTQAVWAENKDGVIIAFRGTVPTELADLVTDRRNSHHPTRALGKVHIGFYAALEIVWKDIARRAKQLRRRDFAKKRELLNSLSLMDERKWDEVLNTLVDWKIPLEGKQNFVRQWKKFKTDPELSDAARDDEVDGLLRFLNTKWVTAEKPIFLTGHSMGGGLATLTAANLLDRGNHIAGLYLFGSPRAGDGEFAHTFERMAFEAGLRENLVRFVNHFDVVARIPPWTGIFEEFFMDEEWREVGRLKYFSEKAPESGSVELLQAEADVQDVARYVKDLPKERIQEWFDDHLLGNYIKKIEQIVYGRPAKCSVVPE